MTYETGGKWSLCKYIVKYGSLWDFRKLTFPTSGNKRRDHLFTITTGFDVSTSAESQQSSKGNMSSVAEL